MLIHLNEYAQRVEIYWGCIENVSEHMSACWL